MDPELKVLLEKANQNFEAQKVKNEALEATIKTLETKHDAAMKIVDGLKGVEGEALKKAVDQVNELVDEISDLRSKMKNPATVVLDDAKQKEAIRELARKSLGVVLKKGKNQKGDMLDSLAEEMELQIKTLNITTGNEGGFAVAEILAMDILDYAREFSPVASLVGMKTSMTRDYRQLIKVTYPSVAEGIENVAGTVPAVTSTQKYVEVKSKEFKLYAQPRITNEALMGTDIDIYADLRMSLGEEIGIYLAAQLLFGDGTGKNCRGILSSNRVNITNLTGESFKPTLTPTGVGARAPDFFPVFATGVSGSLGADDVAIVDYVIDVTNALPTRYLNGAYWIMNRKTKGIFEKVRDADNRPIFTYDYIEGLPGRRLMLNGYPVMIDDTMPDVAADSLFAIFGRLDLAFAMNNGDVSQMLLDPYTEKGNLLVYTEQEYFEQVQRSDAILVCAATANAGA